jgi:hypothetical protein
MMKKFSFALIFALLLSGVAFAQGPTGPVVSEIAISERVEHLVPVIMSNTFPLSVDHLYCYTKIIGATKGDTIIHRWKVNGKAVRDQELQVAGPTWRTFSYKNLNGQTGNWTVDVIYNGKVLKSKSFVVKE